MDVANASLYDGSTATAEAVLMAERVTRPLEGRVAGNLHPEYREVVDTYIRNAGIAEITLPFDAEDGTLHPKPIAELGLRCRRQSIVQSPNFFGGVEDLRALAEATHRSGALFVVVVAEGLSLGLLRAPGRAGADIVCGEAQSFGIPLSFGGSYCGFFARPRKITSGRFPAGSSARRSTRRAARLRADAGDARAAHPPREGDVEHLHQPGALRADGDDLPFDPGPPRRARGRRTERAESPLRTPRRIAGVDGYGCASTRPFFNEFVVSCPRPAEEILAPARRRRRSSAASPLSRFFPEMTNEILFASPRRRRRRRSTRWSRR